MTSDFQREVLSDDVITDAEFREVRQRYVDCLGDAGIRAEALDYGGYDIYSDLSGEDGDVEVECSRNTLMFIEPLYYSIRANPENEDLGPLVVECLQKQGIVDTSFTDQDWDRFVTAFSAAAGDGSGPTPPVADLPTLPGGTRMDDPRVQQCSDNPLGL